jgi:cation:H+ antiporter
VATSDIVRLVLGLVLLTAGAELLVRGAAGGARRLGASSLLVGLTVVAYGTSAPELAVSVEAAWSSAADIAVGNVVGSNLFNVLVILGLAAVIAPLPVAGALLRIDVPIMIGGGLLIVLAALDGTIGRIEGLLLATGCVVYTIFLVTLAMRERAASQSAPADAGGASDEVSHSPWLALAGFTVAGFAGLVFGAHWLVEGASAVARSLGASELVIGLTLVAAGTSMPELATSIVAALRGERDIAVGNVVGSNIFNSFAVLGSAGLVSGTGVAVAPAVLTFDLPFMCAISLACLPIFFTSRRIDRLEGALFLAYYVAYTTYLFLSATSSELAPSLRSAMLYIALPLTGVGLGIAAARAHTRAPARAGRS